jgi:hypothetical protein
VNVALELLQETPLGSANTLVDYKNNSPCAVAGGDDVHAKPYCLPGKPGE